MLATIILVFVLAFLTLFAGKLLRTNYIKLVGLLPLSLFIFFCTYIPKLQAGTEAILFKNNWVPSLGISLDFKIDGLSLLFSLLVTGIGTLIYLYAADYLKGHVYLNRFYSFLGLFMASMLGLVLSDNLITLFIFWELTSITSYFLIGFNHEDEAARKSGLWAFSITGLGGLFLLAGFTMIGSIAGTYSITELLTASTVLTTHSTYPLLLVFIFLGAFTKSAQFPFYFWLPGAMKAPTPVSAYLHSATMVKAGVYLLARFSPILNDSHLWTTSLLVVGGFTMFFGAFHAVFRKDLKGILAYSTISALGVLVFLLGLGTPKAITAFSVFLVAHALYKAALFMVTGTLDHTLHTRDIRQLGGLRKSMPYLALAGVISALSSAGVPLTFGFIAKELVYEATLSSVWANLALGMTILAVGTNVLLSSSGFLVGIKPFFGRLSEIQNPLPKLKLWLWLSPLILALFTLIFGLFPMLGGSGLTSAATHAVLQKNIEIDLKIWHGFNEVLLLSGVTLLLGVVFYFVFSRWTRSLDVITYFERFAPQRLVSYLLEQFRKLAFHYTRLFQDGYLRHYLMVIIVFFIVLVGYKLFADVPLQVNTAHLSEFRAYELVVFMIAVAAILFTIYTPSRLTAIASIGVVGYCICLIFVFYGAPDLAMTQFTIDTLTVVLFVLVLFKLPSFLQYRNRKIQIRDAVVSIAFGTLIALITLQALVSPADKEVSRFYAENTYVLAKGRNVVNVILVDFRGFDTLIETIVLSIAALGVLSLLKYKIKDNEK